jgi:quercetin dioxygenase-like cupin family protein
MNKKFRWSKVYESSEEELTTLLQSRNIQATQIVGEAGSEPVQHNYEQDSTIWCAEGSLTVTTGTERISLQPGDALRLAAQAQYSLQPGISGYVCYLSN